MIGIGLLAYGNSFTGSFIFDDVPSIPENPTIRHLWPVWQTLTPPRVTTVEGRPLINLSLAINYALGGTKVWGYHALNLIIHILTGLTLLGIVRRTLKLPLLRQRFGSVALPLALATAAIWTVHPLQTESVTYMVQRTESIMGLFYLLTLYCAIRGAESESPNIWYSLSATSCLLGMASKEVMVSAPLIVLLYDRTFLSGSLKEVWRKRGRFYAALASTWILLGYLVISTGNRSGTAGLAAGVAWQAYALTQLQAIALYLKLSVWPHPLVFDYGTGVAQGFAEVAPDALIVISLLVGTLIALRRWPAVGFLGAWFFIILAPTSSVVPVATQTMAEHRMYLPLAAVVAMVIVGGFELGSGFLRTRPRLQKTIAWGTGGSLVLLLAFLTIRRNHDYRSELTIWRSTVQNCPNNPRAHYNLGHTLEKTGRIEEAIRQYEQALRIEPDQADTHNSLGVTLVQVGRIPEAILHYVQALRIKPDYAEAHNNLGNILFRIGKLEDAIGHYKQALRIKPNYAEAHNNLGGALMRSGEIQEAMGHWEQAVWNKPDFAEAQYNLANAQFQAGQTDEAIVHWEQALRIRPDYAEAHNDIGVALSRVGRVPEAIGHFELALRINPNYADAHYNLGVVLERAGKLKEAAGHYEEAVRINPGYAGAQKRLAALRAVR